MSQLEDELLFALKVEGLPEPEREYRFCKRRWRFDFAYPEHKIAIEVEGGTWVNGAHSRGAHYQSDCEKYNNAVLLGWKVLRITGAMIGNAPDIIKQLIEKENNAQ